MGTDNGRVQLFEVGEMRNEFNVALPPGSIQNTPEASRKSL